jgi:hypothetical protein
MLLAAAGRYLQGTVRERITRALQQSMSRPLSIPFVVQLLVLGPLMEIALCGTWQAEADRRSEASATIRVERLPIAGGAELVTLFGRVQGAPENGATTGIVEIPLVSILRDSLGDQDPTNDRLRDVWMLTYTRPALTQQVAAAVPFFYNRFGNKKGSPETIPPPITDLLKKGPSPWNRFSWALVQQRLFDASDLLVGSSTRTYRRNRESYYQAHLGRTLAILTLCENQPEIDPGFSTGDLQQIQARLILHEKTLGGLVQEGALPGLHRKRSQEASQQRAQNWELLRQRAEEEGLYFEPLEMPGGPATHALLWVDRSEVSAVPKRRFNGRFLSIASPWHDPKLANWERFSQVRLFDSENRPVSSETANAKAVELIPLAVYGLDHPKIPVLLVDFRKSFNPKGRELSRYAVDDVSRYLFSLTPFGNLNFLIARSVFQFVASKRGIDMHQPSRLRTYSQLKLLLSLNEDFDPDFRDEISRRVERVSTNSLENDRSAEVQLARQQYQALVAYAKRPDGLPARLARDRQVEMSAYLHGGTTGMWLRLSNIFSLGLYKHREAIDPGFPTDLSLQRQTAYHTRFLEEVLKSGSQVEVAWNIQDVRSSLEFLVEQAGLRNSTRTAEIVARLFEATEDAEVRELCLASLDQINSPGAQRHLLLLSQRPQLDPKWRALINSYVHGNTPEARRTPVADFPSQNSTGG